MFNPGDLEASVELSFLPAAGERARPSPTCVVPPSSFSVVDVNALAEVPAGPHSVLVNVVGDQTPVVVERVLTRPLDDTPATTVLLGSQITVPSWYVIEPAVAPGGVLVVMNSAGAPDHGGGQGHRAGRRGRRAGAGGGARPGRRLGDDDGARERRWRSRCMVEGGQPVVVEWRARVARR